jgi:hypothetical protein
LVAVSKIKFTKHAVEKFELMKRYGFEISKKQVVETVLNPERLSERDNQYFAIKVINSKHALRVVYEKRKGYLVAITFYPVRRERYGV